MAAVAPAVAGPVPSLVSKLPPQKPLPSSRKPDQHHHYHPLLGSLLLLKRFLLPFLMPLLAFALVFKLRSLLPPQQLLGLCFLRLFPASNSWLSLSVYAALLLTAVVFSHSRRSSVYLIDFACFRAGDDRKVSREYFIGNSKLTKVFTDENLEFQKKILERSGIGQETYFPKAVTNVPPNPCLDEARNEAETVMFGAMDDLFRKTQINVCDIGILVVNCSAFCPSPSLTAMIVNRYKMRSNIAAYNLAGMGCSAGVIAVDLAKRLLKVRPRTYAVVLSTENITLNWYRGNDRNMLVSNCIFRMGGSVSLLSNFRSDKAKAKYQLMHTVRTTKAFDDKCFYCVQQEEDLTGILGVLLSRELMTVAGSALKTNITTLGPLVLPFAEQLLFFGSLVARQVLKMSVKPYVPDFSKAFSHFCIHAGGRAVLDEVEKTLNLSDHQMEPSRMTLYRFGNTSSSSIWYELAYLEAKGRIHQGDRVWQIGFGSGFKCNSAVWKALEVHKGQPMSNCWSDFIDSLPVPIPIVAKCL